MATKNTPLRKHSKFVRYVIKGPVKILARARDFYVSSITGCSGHVAYYGGAMGCPTPHHSASFPRSFSSHSSYSSDHNYDVRELIRFASERGLTGKTEAGLLRSGKSPAAVTRSRTVGIGRIDEDKPCEFGEIDVGERTSTVYPKSRSYSAAYSKQRRRSILV